jgi:hypothetical protein
MIYILIYDNHENHIINEFIIHVIFHNILILHLFPHISHLLQSLNIELFESLKKYLLMEIKSFIYI